MSSIAERLNWKHASIIMALATVMPPHTTLVYGIDGQSVYIVIIALFWAIYPPVAAVSGFRMLDDYSLPGGFYIGFFNIVFAFMVIRFIRGDSSKRKTLAVGALTTLIPLVSLVFTWPLMVSKESFPYLGPIPIQLAIGLLLMRFIGPKEPTTPW